MRASVKHSHIHKKIQFTNVSSSDKKDVCFICVHIYMQIISYVDVHELFSANRRQGILGSRLHVNGSNLSIYHEQSWNHEQ